MSETNMYCVLHDDNNKQTNSKVIVSANNESDNYCNYFNSIKKENQVITKKKCCDKDELMGKFDQVDESNTKGVQFYKTRFNNTYRTCGHSTETECDNRWPSSWGNNIGEWNKYDNFMKCLTDETSPTLKNKYINFLTLNHNNGHPYTNYINKLDELCPTRLQNDNLINYLVKSEKEKSEINNKNIKTNRRKINNIDRQSNVMTNEIISEQEKLNNKNSLINILTIILLGLLIIIFIYIYSHRKDLKLQNKLKI